MKKILILLLILSFVLNSGVVAYAGTDTTYNQLKKLGYTDHIIKFLDEEEKKEIIENQYVFSGENINNILLINEITTFDNQNKIIKSYATDIDELEKTKLNVLSKTLFKDKEYKDSFLKEKLNEIKSKKIEPLVYYLNSNGKVVDESYVINSMPSYAEDSIEDCILTTGVYAYDKSTSTKVIKRLGFNFQWEGTPMWALHDLIAIQHTGSGIGFTNVERMGGSYTYFDVFNNSTTIGMDVESNLYGAIGEYDIKMSHLGYGEMYLDISNSKNAIPPGSYFTMYGQYGHVTITLGASVSVGAGGISFTPTLASKVVKSTKLMYNNIYTY